MWYVTHKLKNKLLQYINSIDKELLYNVISNTDILICACVLIVVLTLYNKLKDM